MDTLSDKEKLIQWFENQTDPEWSIIRKFWTIVSYTEGKFLKPSVYQWTISYSDYQRIVVLAEGIAGSEPAAFQVIRETIDELKRDFKLLHGKE